ncbi:hypothetical protein DRO58_06080, partial [Candidatus Bathyarchaeota archaeon]
KGEGASFQEIEEELKRRGFETAYLSNVFRKEPRVIPDWEGRYFAVEPGMFDYGKLKDHELELVKRRFERAASEIRERREEFKAEAKKIEEELERRRMEYESWKEWLVEKAKAGTLTYAETPEDNPFKLVWHPEKEEDWDELRKHELLRPYVEAKDRAKEVVYVLKTLGKEADPEKIFRDYVELEKAGGFRVGSENDPYRDVWKTKWKARDLQFKVNTVFLQELLPRGEYGVQPCTILEKFSSEDRDAAKLALIELVKEGGYRVKDFRTGKEQSPDEPVEDFDYIAPPKDWKIITCWLPWMKGRRPSGKGIRAIQRLDLLHHDSLVVRIDAGGDAHVEAFTPDHVALFRGRIDFPELELEPGLYKITPIGGELSALTSPNAIIKEGEKYYRFLKFSKDGLREYTIEVEKAEEPPEEIPEIKVKPENYVGVPAKMLKELLKGVSDDSLSYLKFTFEKGKWPSEGRFRISLCWGASWGEEVIRELPGEDIEKKGVYEIRDRGSELTAKYLASRIKPLISLLNPNTLVYIRFGEDKPMKIEFEDPLLEGEYWLAPWIVD